MLIFWQLTQEITGLTNTFYDTFWVMLKADKICQKLKLNSLYDFIPVLITLAFGMFKTKQTLFYIVSSHYE